MNEQTVKFLSSVEPFDILPENEISRAAQNLTHAGFPADRTLFVQNKSILNHIYIVSSGKMEKFILEEEDKKLREILGEKSIYGGLSVLFNKSISIRTVRTLEESNIYLLPKEHFLDICSRYPEFIQHFARNFCSHMLQAPYQALITGSMDDEKQVSPSAFLNLKLKDIFSREFASCSEYASIKEAAALMRDQKKSAVVTMNALDQSIGLLTDNDLRSKVVSQNYPVHNPVKEIASRPLITLPEDSQVFEAIIMMMKHSVKHLVITDDRDNVLGIATEQDLLLAQGRSPVYLMREIQLAQTLEELKHRQLQVPGMIKSLMDSGARAGHLNRIITEISDAILKKIAAWTIDEMGHPPARFAFMILGSEGRKEQTLKTDQDNAIVYEDVEPEREEEVRKYFLELGDRICTRLDEVGFSFCNFGIMARNPKWCQSLGQWKTYFWDWIHQVEPEDLLHSSIFFDFRLGYGDKGMVNELRQYLFESLGKWKGFFRHFAENALHFKPPLDFFGNLVIKNTKEKKNCLDIKQPMQLLVDFARLYALKYFIAETNTLDRLEKLRQQGVLSGQDFDELSHAYGFMMLLRLSHQARMIVDDGKPADNLIQPKMLTYIDRQSLKEAFKRIKTAQGKMRMELTQDIGIS
ncbi:putative CBS domain and cyclic nucleotide-regulated nucleotidyltransferase [Desulfonatronospira thiodismutans ASO3-1]|uniref:CBS domain and cyclic nucleotide-regulated nucleotidyltransferase n=2 Tax=Desulfonatronospira TaxID=488937 RepID=D6SM65_9BACT|nr:DUF294 nucleotidyltransferase-like domain-containing protein [Desulfonatronospira thiodismutans]EFI35776.1 putative CBS domain and cyclic nucleotide-regulated nucleotidyltransferase [Desulfonatronospira thiodismutans ASO3-1]